MEPQTLPLRDIHLPQDPGFWPLAPGWWFLLLIIIVCAFYLIRMLLRYKAKQKLISLLQSEVSEITNQFKQHNNKHRLAADISLFLRRFTKYVLRDNHSATLTGQSWLVFLNSKVKQPTFNSHKIELTEAQFNKSIDFDVPSYVATVRNYITQAVHQNKQTYLKAMENVHA